MRDKPPLWSGDTPWCRIEDIDGKFLEGSKSEQVVDEKTIKRMNLKVFPIGTVICSCSARLGVCAIVARKLVSNQTFIGLVPGKELDAEYLYYEMTFKASLLQALSSGTTIAYLPRVKFEQFEIEHPNSKTEQTKIAEVLSVVDRAIEQTEALIAKQQRIKTGMMQGLLTHGVDEHGKLRSEQTHSFKDSPLGKIPIDWEVDTLEQLTSRIVDGIHHTPAYVESGVPFIVITDLTEGSGIDFSKTRFVTERDHREFFRRADPMPGDVLVTKDGTLGIARIIPPNAPEFSIFVSVAMLRPRQSICLPELIWAFFESGEFLRQLGALSAGTGLAHIHLEHFRKFLIRRPPIDEQRAIVRALNKQQELLNRLISASAKLNKQKTALMQDLLTGRRRVIPLLESEPKREKIYAQH